MPAADVYRSLWRHRLLITVLTLLAAVSAYAFSSAQPKVYEASALIRIQQRVTTQGEAFGSLELGRRLAQTYAQIVKADAIKREVHEEFAQLEWDQIEIDAEPVGDVELLRVTARSESPEIAAGVANEATAALQRFVSETGTVRDQIVVVDRAGVPATAIAPRPKTTTALVILLALLFNGALALLRDFLSDRLPDVHELEEKFGEPVLATVPPLSLKLRQQLAPSVAVAAPHVEPRVAAAGGGAAPAAGAALPERERGSGRSVLPFGDGWRGKGKALPTRRGLADVTDIASEPFRTLRLSLDLRPDAAQSNVMVFTSAEAGEGKSTVAANYALVSAANERSVLLIDADIRNPSQHEIFAVPQKPGLTDLIGADPDVGIVANGVWDLGRLEVVTAGLPVPRPGDLTGSRFMRELLKAAAAAYDLVVVDTPPVLSTSDAANIASAVDGEVVVVVERSQRSRRVSAALKKLDLVGVSVVGLVVNREGRLSDYGYAA